MAVNLKPYPAYGLYKADSLGGTQCRWWIDITAPPPPAAGPGVVITALSRRGGAIASKEVIVKGVRPGARVVAVSRLMPQALYRITRILWIRRS